MKNSILLRSLLLIAAVIMIVQPADARRRRTSDTYSPPTQSWEEPHDNIYVDPYASYNYVDPYASYTYVDPYASYTYVAPAAVATPTCKIKIAYMFYADSAKLVNSNLSQADCNNIGSTVTIPNDPSSFVKYLEQGVSLPSYINYSYSNFTPVSSAGAQDLLRIRNEFIESHKVPYTDPWTGITYMISKSFAGAEYSSPFYLTGSWQ